MDILDQGPFGIQQRCSWTLSTGPTSGYISKGNKNRILKSNLYSCCSIIHSSHKWKQHKLLITVWMDKEDVIHTHTHTHTHIMGCYSAMKKGSRVKKQGFEQWQWPAVMAWTRSRYLCWTGWSQGGYSPGPDTWASGAMETGKPGGSQASALADLLGSQDLLKWSKATLSLSPWFYTIGDYSILSTSSSVMFFNLQDSQRSAMNKLMDSLFHCPGISISPRQSPKPQIQG